MPSDVVPFMQALRVHMLIEQKLSPSTVKQRLARLRHAVKEGFDLEGFGVGPAQAEAAGRDYLAQRLAAPTVYPYNNDAKTLNNLAAYFGYREVKFKRRRPPPAQPRTLSDRQLAELIAWYPREPFLRPVARAVVLVATQTGLRPSELARMRVEHLDPVDSRIDVPWPAKGGCGGGCRCHDGYGAAGGRSWRT